MDAMVAAADIADAALRWLVRREWKGIGSVAVHGPEDLSYDEAPNKVVLALKS